MRDPCIVFNSGGGQKVNDTDQATNQWMEPLSAGASEDLRHREDTFGSRDPSGLLAPSKQSFLKSRPKKKPWLGLAGLGKERRS